MGMTPFVWGEGGEKTTPAQVKRRREIAQAMMQKGIDTSPVESPWQGVARIAQAISGKYQSDKADAAEQVGQAGAASQFKELLSAGPNADMGKLGDAMANPWANEGTTAIAKALMDRKFSDPLDAEYKRAQIDALRQKSTAENTVRRSLTPVYGQDASGKTVLLQPADDGSANMMRLPEGVTVANGFDKVDLGTSWGVMDKRTGQMVQTVPKDIAGEEAAKVQGKSQGEAVANLGGDIAKAEKFLGDIERVRKDPNREWGTGASSMLNVVPGTGGYDFQQKVNQLQGQAFLEAYTALRGGGQITEVEGAKAEAAIARLNTAQTEQGFLQALNDLEAVVRSGVERARQKAGASSQPSSPIVTTDGITITPIP